MAKTVKELLETTDFANPSEANEFMSTISNLLENPALIAWAKATDTNFETSTYDKLCEAYQAFDDFYDDVLDAF